MGNCGWGAGRWLGFTRAVRSSRAWLRLREVMGLGPNGGWAPLCSKLGPICQLIGRPIGRPWVRVCAHALPMTNRVAHGRDPWVEIATHTLPIRVGCPWASVPMGQIAGLIPNSNLFTQHVVIYLMERRY
jgi:hypothetical protein